MLRWTLLLFVRHTNTTACTLTHTHLSELQHLLVFPLQQTLQLVDAHLGVGQSSRPLVVLLGGPGRQAFALQHLQQFLYGFIPGGERRNLKPSAL